MPDNLPMKTDSSAAGTAAGPRSPSIDKALAIIELLSGHADGLRMIDIARRLELPKSSTHLTLEVLRTHRYVERDGEGAYRLGLKLFAIASRLLNGLEIRHVARPHLESLTRRTGLTSHLAVLDGNEIVYVDRVDGRGLVKFDTYVGKRAPVNLTAVGKAIAAYLPDERLDEILAATFRRGTERAPALPHAFKEQLRSYRASGFTLEDEEEVPGVYCVGAPVRNLSGAVIASVGVIGLKRDLAEGSLESLGGEVRRTADHISELLGHHAALESPSQG